MVPPDTNSTAAADEPKMSIGSVSQATDIPRQTLRTWERRYGFPSCVRNDAGHRQYSPDTVTRLRLVARAVEAGQQVSSVIGLDKKSLKTLLEASDTVSDAAWTLSPSSDDKAWRQRWLSTADCFDLTRLSSELNHAWTERGSLDFLEDRLGPFFRFIGKAWCNGQLSVAQEHWISEYMRDFLVSRWRPLSDQAQGPRLVLANPQKERHTFGLHMAALVCALAGCRICFLGADTPLDTLCQATRDLSAAAILLSISEAYESDQTVEYIEELDRQVSQETTIVVGGQGRQRVEADTLSFVSWRGLYDWASTFANQPW